MTCKAAQSKFSAYVDGELSGFEMLDMRSHLHGCEACMEEMEQLRKLKWILGNMSDVRPSEGFADRLKVAVFAADRRQRASRVPVAVISGSAFVLTLILSFAALRTRAPQAVAAAGIPHPVESQPNFDLSRDQAWQSGGDSFSDGSLIITASSTGSTYGPR